MVHINRQVRHNWLDVPIGSGQRLFADFALLMWAHWVLADASISRATVRYGTWRIGKPDEHCETRPSLLEAMGLLSTLRRPWNLVRAHQEQRLQ
jgi:hypothetical protein